MTEEKLALHDLDVRNLQRLAKYLESGLKPGTEFDMKHFYNSHEADAATECGTVGCAVGHGPYAGIPKSQEETWAEYSYRVFGIPSYSNAWEWLFGVRWAYSEKFSDHLSAAKRIHVFLKAGNSIPWSSEDPEIKAMLDDAFKSFDLN